MNQPPDEHEDLGEALGLESRLTTFLWGSPEKKPVHSFGLSRPQATSEEGLSAETEFE